jgi:hypothetical protein
MQAVVIIMALTRRSCNVAVQSGGGGPGRSELYGQKGTKGREKRGLGIWHRYFWEGKGGPCSSKRGIRGLGRSLKLDSLRDYPQMSRGISKFARNWTQK